MKQVFILHILLLSFISAYTQSFDLLEKGEHYYRHEAARLNDELQPFYHGVASGDPLHNSVIIWTRVTPDDFNEPAAVEWFVATDQSMANVVQQGIFTTSAQRDFTVKVDVGNLEAGKYYYYSFRHNGFNSIVGRTKTAPLEGTNRMRVGLATCSDYRSGYFQSYLGMARRNDLDLVLHMGDYIYEGGGGPADRQHEPNQEIYTLANYRARYSQYRLDTMLQLCHRAHPWMTIWDDHDIVVDALRDTSFRHNPSFGSYAERKLAAITAAREWLPMRDPDPGEDIYKNWRSVNWGNLAEIVMIDVRLYDRDRFAESVADTIYGRADHKMMGPVQLAWFNSTIRSTPARWKVVGNQLMFSHFGLLGIPFVLENWDGYPFERNQIFNNLQSNRVNNLIFATGDFHCSFANDVPRDPNNPVLYNRANGRGSLAVEFVLPSINAGNLDEGFAGLDDIPGEILEGGVQLICPHTKYVELTEHGYVLLDITPERAQGEFWFQDDIRNPAITSERCAAVWQTRDAENRLVSGDIPSEPITGLPIIPPYRPLSGSVSTQDPKAFTLLGIYPNPVADELIIQYHLNEMTRVSVEVVGMNGQEVVVLQSDVEQQSGQYLGRYQLPDLPKGAYILVFKSNTEAKTYKLVKL
jgi:alkaline phosphatase D